MRRVVEREGRDDSIEEIRHAVAVHGQRGPDVEGNYSTCCPFCEGRVQREDREFKLTWKVTGQTRPQDGREPVALSLERGVWNCYRCGARGFSDFTWMDDPPEPAPEAAPAPPRAPADLGPPDGFVPLDECARSISMRWVAEYFAGRGVLDQARDVGAGGCARWTYRRRDGTTFQVDEGRAVVPFVAERGGPWVGYSARLVRPRRARPGAVAREAVKYLYPGGMDRRTALWGAAYVRALPRTGPRAGLPGWVGPLLEAAVVVEGVFDALPLYPKGVATLGKSVSAEQLDALVALRRPLWVALDGDAWRECRALAARLALRGAPDVGWCHLPPGQDPGTLGWKIFDYCQPGQ